MKKRLVSIILALVLFCLPGFESIAISVQDMIAEEEVSAELLNNNFTDDSVIVTIKKEYSDYNRVFSVEDFPDIECESVEDLNAFARKDIADYRKEVAKASNTSDIKSASELNISDEEIIQKLNINVDNYMNFLCINLKEKGKLNVIRAIKKLKQHEEVLSAGPNYIYTLNSVYPNDADYGEQWAIDSIQLPEAWEYTKGSNTIRVGVIDSGIDSSHPDLSGKVYNTHYVFFDDPDNGRDTLGHGTHVAGIIGAKTNNSVGVAGTCWNVELVSLKVVENVGGKGNIETQYVISAVNNGKALNLDILNLSLGGYGFDDNEKNALDSYGRLVVCSAGNGKDTNGDDIEDTAVNTDVQKFYPSCYDCSNIISVTSCDSSKQFPDIRNYGATTVDLAAPGENIMSTVSNGGYESWNGTSMAAPYVTGVAALMMSVNSSLKNNPVAVKNIILSTVDKNSNFTDKCVSGGTLNAYKAVLGAKNNYTYMPLGSHGGRFFYTDDTDWFGTSCTNRVMAARINNDSRTDLLAINYDGDICYTLNNGKGTYQNQVKITWGGFAPSWFWNTYNRRVWAADVNGDGYDDLIGVSTAGKIYTAINNKNNTFSAPVIRTGTAFVSSSGWFSTATRERVWPGDINGDGRADLMGISTEGNVYYALANSSGGYSNQTKITVTNGFANSWFSKNYNNRIWVADVNADGYDDFIGVSVDGHIYTSINNKNFTFTTPTSKGGTAFVSSSAWFSTEHSGRVWPADLNADGRCDLVGISDDGNVYSCTANADGTYGSEVRNLVVEGSKFNESWFSNTNKSRIFIGFVDRYATPDFIGISINGYANVSLQLCKTR